MSKPRDEYMLDAVIKNLEQHPDYRLLRRHVPVTRYRDPAGVTDLKRGLYLDVETTGLDLRKDKIIELAMLPFTFDASGLIYEIAGGGLHAYEDPQQPISAEITEITGITDEMVKGQAISDPIATAMIDDADLLISHNAGFDRPMMERRFKAAAKKAWGCSMLDVPWKAYGCRDKKLAHLLAHFRREFYEGHRALDDARAGLHLLEALAPLVGEAEFKQQTFLRWLIDNARETSVRVWAVGSPFEKKDTLKARGYRWNAQDGVYSLPKVWYRDVKKLDVFEEIAWLAQHIYGGMDILDVPPPVVLEEFGAKTRYSCRPGKQIGSDLAGLVAGPPDDGSDTRPPLDRLGG